ncbi:MAG: DNA/RNA non-specific endonuclease [Chitinophagaceae bacterium]
MQNPKRKILEAVANIQATHPGLADELKKLRRNAEVVSEAKKLAPKLSHLEGGLESAGGPNFALETIVLRTGRPVLAVSHNKAVLEFTDAKSKFWKEKLQAASSLLINPIKAIGRIEVENHPDYQWLATGWLIDSTTVVTNRHVANLFGKKNGSRFVFRQGESSMIKVSIDFLEEFDNSDENTFQITGILHIEDENGPDIALLSAVPIAGTNLPQFISLSDTVPVKGQEVVVIGYPARDSRIRDQQLMVDIFGDVYDKKRLAPGQAKGMTGGNLLHDCSTLGGNSGSAVLDLKTGKAVGLHFAGRFLETNFAVPAAIIKERLNNLRRPSSKPTTNKNEETDTNGGDKTLFQSPSIQAGNNSLDVTIPIHISIRMGDIVSRQVGNLANKSTTAATDADEAEEFITEGNPADYDDREGYDPDFLDEKVPLPTIKSAAKKKDILQFGNNKTELKYCHFSVMMSKSRRQCFFSAVNIDGETSISMKRGGWRLDPRIPDTAQIMKECYGNAPKFSRGHMTRREDPIWGKTAEASLGNSDSMHVTNTVPQMQNMNAGIWLALENYALQNARKDDQRISVFTGPVFKPSDPDRFGVTIPIRFWKVIAFIHDDTGKLCATGYTISQEEFLQEEEFVFGKHKTAQVSIHSIEKDTGLSFGRLGGLDPFETATEALQGPVAPLQALTEIRFV